MARSDLRLALICRTRHEMCRISRPSLSCAHALELVVLVESESGACMGSVLLVSANVALYSPRCFVLVTMTTLIVR
jgi:hypothetical protein